MQSSFNLFAASPFFRPDMRLIVPLFICNLALKKCYVVPPASFLLEKQPSETQKHLTDTLNLVMGSHKSLPRRNYGRGNISCSIW